MSEPLEEAPQGIAETSRLQEPEQPPRKHPRLGLIAWVSGMIVLVVLFALLFAAFNHRSTASGGNLPPVPAGWQRYTDPSGLFTIAIPNGWTVQRQTSDATLSADSQFTTVHQEMEGLGGPPGGQNTITVWIVVMPIVNDFTRHWWCQDGWPQNTTLAGLPAYTDGRNMWIVNSSGAHFQINYTYPNYKGDVLIPANAPSPTPMPPGFYEKGQQDLHAILASFLPTPDTPLKCN